MHANFKISYLILLLVIIFLIFKYVVPFFQQRSLQAKTIELYRQLPESKVPWVVVGYSENKHPIYLFESGQGPDTVLIMGVFHGDEPAGFHLVVRLADTLYKNPNLVKAHVVLVPVVNPDGLLKGRRTNAHGVDINRNFPTTDWTPVYTKKRFFPGREPGSEVETQIVMELLERYKPDRIISIHAPLRMNNFNGPAEMLAETMAKYNGYPVRGDVGYSTPGSFGTYAGVELKIPTITLELPGEGPKKAWQENFKALIAAINFQGY